MDVTQENIDKFNKELNALLDRYGFILGSEALLVDGKIASKPVISVRPTPTETAPKKDPDMELPVEDTKKDDTKKTT